MVVFLIIIFTLLSELGLGSLIWGFRNLRVVKKLLVLGFFFSFFFLGNEAYGLLKQKWDKES